MALSWLNRQLLGLKLLGKIPRICQATWAHFGTKNPQTLDKSLHSPNSESKAAPTRITHPPTLPDLACFSPGISGLVQKLSKLAAQWRHTSANGHYLMENIGLAEYRDIVSKFIQQYRITIHTERQKYSNQNHVLQEEKKENLDSHMTVTWPRYKNMASTSNAENLVKMARIVYQLCDYTDFRAVFLKTRICQN